MVWYLVQQTILGQSYDGPCHCVVASLGSKLWAGSGVVLRMGWGGEGQGPIDWKPEGPPLHSTQCHELGLFPLELDGQVSAVTIA